MNEISSTKQNHFIFYGLLYNNKEYILMMADVEAETCSC